MVEVVDGWLAKLHPNKPTWREIADVVESIGHHDLAHSLRQVYISGDLFCVFIPQAACQHASVIVPQPRPLVR